MAQHDHRFQQNNGAGGRRICRPGAALLFVSLLAFSVCPGFAQGTKAKQEHSAGSNTHTIDLNTASKSELDSLPGVGPATSRKIIAGRPYSSVADLQRAGVPQATVDKIAPLVSVSGSVGRVEDVKPGKDHASQVQAGGRKIDLNTATESELDALPGVGPATAKKIITARPISSVTDLQRAGVPKATIDKIAPLVVAGGAVGSASRSLPAPPSQPGNTRGSAGSADAQAPRSTASSVGSPGPGMVWVNTETKIFHREGDRWYGKTKNGRYMSEADAIRSGFREAKTGGSKK